MLQLRDLHDISVEGIDHQYYSALGAELEEELKHLRNFTSINNTHIDNSNLNKIVKKHTGIIMLSLTLLKTNSKSQAVNGMLY